MKLICILLFLFIVWYCYKKRSLLTYRKAVDEVINGDAAVGLELLRKASRQGLTPNQEIQAAYAELKYGDPKQAKAKLNIILMNSKAKPAVKYQARCMMAIIRLNEKEIDDARETLESLYQEGFRNSNFYATYGYMAILTRDRDYYTKINEEAYQYNSDNLVICDNYGLCLFLNGDYQKASQIYEALMEREPKFPEAYYNYACVLEQMGDKTKAVDMLQAALSQEFSGVTTIKREQVEGMLARLTE